jgi:hypothetical protein
MAQYLEKVLEELEEKGAPGRLLEASDRVAIAVESVVVTIVALGENERAIALILKVSDGGLQGQSAKCHAVSEFIPNKEICTSTRRCHFLFLFLPLLLDTSSLRLLIPNLRQHRLPTSSPRWIIETHNMPQASPFAWRSGRRVERFGDVHGFALTLGCVVVSGG